MFDNQEDVSPFGDADDESSQDNSEFITINVTNETGESRELDHIKEKDVNHPTHSHQAIGPAASTSASSHMRSVVCLNLYSYLNQNFFLEEAFRQRTTILEARLINRLFQRTIMIIHAKITQKSFAFSSPGCLSWYYL